LVLCTKEAADAWTGVDADDYDLACTVEGFLGTVSSHGNSYLVFADEPMETTFLLNWDTVVVAQWVSCSSKSRANELLTALPDQLDVLAPEVTFELANPTARLFDAGTPGEALESMMAVPLEAGVYSITTENYAGTGFRFIIYRFRLLPTV
jgi:hypothetical protein